MPPLPSLPGQGGKNRSRRNVTQGEDARNPMDKKFKINKILAKKPTKAGVAIST